MEPTPHLVALHAHTLHAQHLKELAHAVHEQLAVAELGPHLDRPRLTFFLAASDLPAAPSANAGSIRGAGGTRSSPGVAAAVLPPTSPPPPTPAPAGAAAHQRMPTTACQHTPTTAATSCRRLASPRQTAFLHLHGRIFVQHEPTVKSVELPSGRESPQGADTAHGWAVGAAGARTLTQRAYQASGQATVHTPTASALGECPACRYGRRTRTQATRANAQHANTADERAAITGVAMSGREGPSGSPSRPPRGSPRPLAAQEQSYNDYVQISASKRPTAPSIATQSVRAPSPLLGLVLDHSHLWPGNQAALLSHERTLELYRANAKKTQDPDPTQAEPPAPSRARRDVHANIPMQPNLAR
ncbi:hypothetical protein EVJ58_g10332 [Rhodofomes roseus]|uniref:Uncharacterized protein n=1 Tax=Rhodofomes roseus TaxID=34475 RepID=A0A4Y9XQ40_9APHY|nr:hypothetical protein EVJ58_g10332 [Rhodofomes roseus]